MSGVHGAFDFSAEGVPQGRLQVVSVRGREALSRPFTFEILARADGAEAASLQRDLLGSKAHLTLRGPGEGEASRVVHGVVRRVEAESTSGAGELLHTRIWLAPRLWTLRRNKNSRIFQEVTVAEILARIFGESLVRSRFDLVRSLRPRDYCVQYQESDLAFAERLLAEEGMYYGFEHPPGESDEEIVVITDDARLAPPIAGDPCLTFRDSEGMAERESDVRRFSKGQRVRPTRTLLREYDWTRPSLDLRAAAEVGPDEQVGSMPAVDLRPVETPGAPELPRVFTDNSTQRIYDHTGELGDVSTRDAAARQHLEQHRAQSVIAQGESRCRRLVPGRYFELVGAPAEGHDGRYLVLEVEHEGSVPEAGSGAEVYRNKVRCAPASVAYRPARPRRRIQQVLETAVVVGPRTHEIHTDAHGRIKVQFHWDRQGRGNDHSSCWIRVMQAWAGAGWGFQFIPRVGMEVVVGFAGGDVDRPMVLGSVYNAENAVPFQLPREKSKSGIRTRTHRGPGGSNELSFEDHAGFERVYLHGQKDIDTHAENNHTARAGANLTEQIGQNRYSLVGGSSFHSISGDVVSAVGGAERQSVDGSRSVSVQGDVEAEITGNVRERVQRDVEREVRGEQRLRTSGEVRLEAGADVLARVRGSLTEVVGESSAPKSRSTHVEGRLETASTGETIVRSDQAVTLACGDSYIRVANGTIEICASSIVLRGEDASATLGGGDLKLRAKGLLGGKSDDTVAFYSSGGHVTLASDVKIDGSQVKLKSPGSSWSDEDPESGQETTIELVDRDGNPLANQRYRLYLADGSERSGTLDEHGKATVRFEGNADIEFPDLGDVDPA